MLLVVIAPLLNFLSGISIDLYAPSMPSIAKYFTASVMATKNTISSTILGMTFGCLIFGVLIDTIGRKRVLLTGIFFYIISSFIAIWSQNIFQLMLIRFIQGVMISTVTIGCRALIIDSISGRRYNIAILYTSIAYGAGPVIGPFIGGIIQNNFGWKANFILLAIIGIILFLLLLLFIKESIPERQPLILRNIVFKYFNVIKHKRFIIGILICSLVQTELMIYPTLGPFIIENILHHSVLVYGNTALLVGSSYLCGALINRFLLHYIKPKQICYYGFAGLVLALLLAYIFTLFLKLNLVTLIIPIILLNISAGFIFPTIMGVNLKQFPKSAGIAMATQTALLALIVALVLFVISHVPINNLISLSIIYTVLVLLQIILFFSSYKELLDT